MGSSIVTLRHLPTPPEAEETAYHHNCCQQHCDHHRIGLSRVDYWHSCQIEYECQHRRNHNHQGYNHAHGLIVAASRSLTSWKTL